MFHLLDFKHSCYAAACANIQTGGGKAAESQGSSHGEAELLRK